MDFNQLTTIRGTDASSVFSVVGEKDSLVIGIRVWVARSAGADYRTFIGARIRIQMKAGQEFNGVDRATAFYGHVQETFPGVKWSNSSKSHVSLSGEVLLSARAEDHDLVLAQYDKHKIGYQIVQIMDGLLQGSDWFLDPAGMEALIHSFVVQDLQKKYKEEKYIDAVSFNFCEVSKKYLDGIELHEGPSMADLVGLGNGVSPVEPTPAPCILKGKIKVPKSPTKHTAKALHSADNEELNTLPTQEA